MSAELAVVEAGAGSEPASLLDVVRRAVKACDGGSGEGCQAAVQSVALSPSWFARALEREDVATKAGGDDLVLWRDVGKVVEAGRLRREKEEALVSELRAGLRQGNGLTAERLLVKLGTFLELVVAGGRDEEGEQDGTARLGRSLEEKEAKVLGLLRRSSARLGSTVVELVMRSCLALRYWSPIQVLLECNVISGRLCDELVQCLVEAGNASLMCLCVRHVLDLRPHHVLVMLQYVLEGGSRSGFQEVGRQWREAAGSAITFAAKKQNRVGKESGSQGSTEQPLTAISVSSPEGLAPALALAMAVDGFSAAELCLHEFFASEQDEAVLASVIGMLSTAEVLSILRYVTKWVDKYQGRLAHMPSPKGTKLCRIPTFAQVLQWASIMLDVHYTRFALASELSNELRSLQLAVRSMVAVSSRISPLAGVAEHLRSSESLPTKNQFGDYFVEYIDV